MNTEKIKTVLFDIRFWILVLALVRLENINLPPLDQHAYRQCLTLGVARNYLEIDDNIFQPRTILCDSRPGFEVMEFPALNYAIFLLWKIFGEQNWCFRLLGVVVASIGLWHLNQILRRLVTDRAALAGTVLFGTSIAFIYARKAMPDVFSLSMVLIGVNIGWTYLEKGKWWRLPLFTVITAIGLLSKIPSACALVLLVLPVFDREIALKRKIWLTVAGSIAVAAMSAWYFVWIPWAEKEYQHGWFFGLSYAETWRQVTVESWGDTKSRFYPIALQSRVAFLLFLFGFVWMVVKKQWKLLINWLLYSAIFLFFILQVGKVFSVHEYYIIPYVPVMALLAGYGLSSVVKNDWLFIAVLGIMAAEAVYWQKADFFMPWYEHKFLKLEAIADAHFPRDAKVVTSDGDANPKMMYMAHRRGWTEKPNRLLDPVWLDGEATVGLEYAIFERARIKDSIPYPMIYEDNEFRIFKIKKD